MKKYKITVLFDTFEAPPENQNYSEELKDRDDPEVEYEAANALKKKGHDVMLLGFYNKIETIFEWLDKQKPEIVFNLTEHFHKQAWLDRSIADLLEILKYPYTGSSAVALLIARNKAITKEILTAHRIKVPKFVAFLKNRKIRIPKHIKFPQIVKPLTEDASKGIAQASIVDDDKALTDRIKFIHESLKCGAISEEFINGRELYVSIIGNERLRVLPIREMKFGDIPNEESRIATYKAKWNEEYRGRWKIQNVFANNIPDDILKRITRISKRAYRALRLRDYGRIDIRLTGEGEIYVLEANPNPYLAKYEDFPESAKKAGIKYNDLMNRILKLAIRRYQ